MRYLAIAVAVLVTGCARDIPITHDADLDAYAQSFEAEALAHGLVVDTSGVLMKMVDGGGALLHGSAEDKVPTLIIGRDLWKTRTWPEKERMVFHALGHFILHRNHNDAIRTDMNAPQSIMALMPFSDRAYGQYRPDYLTELFGAEPL